MTDALIQVTMMADKGHINLRGDPGDKMFVSAAEKTLGQALPVTANSLTENDNTVYWLGPDEYHIVCAAGESARLCKRLTAALKDIHAAVNDISGGQTAFRLHGDAVPQVLAKGCTLDLHADVFRGGDCAQTGLGKAVVLLGRHRAEDEYQLIVRRSFSDYLIKWLTQAAKIDRNEKDKES